MEGEKQHGGKRDGAGRPPGSLNKRSLEAIAEVAERFPDWSPLMHLAAVANDPDMPAEIRLDAAKAAAPYVHPRAKAQVLDADALVDLECRLVRAKIEATAETISRPGLAQRLARAKARVRLADGDAGGVSIEIGAEDAAPIIDVTPASRRAFSAGSAAPRPASAPEREAQPVTPRPVLPHPSVPASIDNWSAPSRTDWPADRPAFAEMDYNLCSPFNLNQ